MQNFARKFENPKNREQEIEDRAEQNEKHAREIAQLGDFELIEKELKEKNLLGQEIERVKNKFAGKIDPKDFPSKSEILWEMFTIQELYDVPTAEHCLGVYLLAKEKINKALYQNIVLAEIIQNEGVDLERFYLACLLHDIGKVETPSLVLNNTTSRDRWKEILFELTEKAHLPMEVLQKLGFEKTDKPSKEEIAAKMQEKNLSANQLVPIKFGMSEEEANELHQKWNMDPEKLSLMDTIDHHATSSKKIIRKKGLPIASIIAGQHHHRNENGMIYPVSVRSLQVSSDMTDILHLVDVQQALESKRPYKESFNQLKVLKILAEHAQQGEVSKEMAFLYIKDIFQKQDTNQLSAEQQEWQKTIEDFIFEFEEGSSKKLLEDWMNKHNIFAQAA